MKSTELICSICDQPIPTRGDWAGGNNAWPINDGRCCYECNDNVVLPARMRQAKAIDEAKGDAP